MKKLFILFIVCSLMAFTIEKTFIILKGEKYFKYKTEYKVDTIQSGYGDLTIVKSQVIYYDHFKK